MAPMTRFSRQSLTIPAGQIYYFKVVGDVAQVAGTTGAAGTVSTKIVGDAAYASLTTLMGAYVTGLGNFVWSPVSTTTAAVANLDWANGFNVSVPSFRRNKLVHAHEIISPSLIESFS